MHADAAERNIPFTEDLSFLNRTDEKKDQDVAHESLLPWCARSNFTLEKRDTQVNIRYDLLERRVVPRFSRSTI